MLTMAVKIVTATRLTKTKERRGSHSGAGDSSACLVTVSSGLGIEVLFMLALLVRRWR